MSDQMSFMPKHRLEPPACYEEVAAVIRRARERTDEEELDWFWNQLLGNLYAFQNFKKDIDRKTLDQCIAILFEREGMDE